jgi:hypothetical protein
MKIRQYTISPRRSPRHNSRPRRLIGSIRRECLDHAVVFGEANLRRVLKTCALYYKQVRIYPSPDKAAPDLRRTQPVGNIVAAPELVVLHRQGPSFRHAQPPTTVNKSIFFVLNEYF